jgi:hypothetical protein
LSLEIFQSEKVAAIADAVVKSAVLMTLSVLICYRWHISEEINKLIRTKILRKKEEQ